MGLSHHCRAWNRWLKAAAELAHNFSAVEDDPFAYNEAATVSLLTAARLDVLHVEVHAQLVGRRPLAAIADEEET